MLPELALHLGVRGPGPILQNFFGKVLKGLKRFQSCYTPEPSSPTGFFLKKKPPRTTLEYGYMNSGTALLRTPVRSIPA